jgi:hypothetical protein
MFRISETGKMKDLAVSAGPEIARVFPSLSLRAPSLWKIYVV